MHTCNAKQAAKYVYNENTLHDGELGLLLEWIYYHDALSAFSVSHFNAAPPEMKLCMTDHQVRRAIRLNADPTRVCCANLTGQC